MSGHVRIGHAIVAAAELEEEARVGAPPPRAPRRQRLPATASRGDEIPLESRIIRVADAFEAMTADRPYRTRAAVRGRVRRARASAPATQFDAACVAALRAALGSDSRPRIDRSGRRAPDRRQTAGHAA